MSVTMYFSMTKKDGLIYEDKKPSKQKTFIRDIRTLDVSKKGLKAITHELTLFHPDGTSKDLTIFSVSCGHDFSILSKMAKNTLIHY